MKLFEIVKSLFNIVGKFLYKVIITILGLFKKSFIGFTNFLNNSIVKTILLFLRVLIFYSIVIFILIFVLDYFTNTSRHIVQSTITRVKLENSESNGTYFTDEVGLLESTDYIVTGLNMFEKKTGVAPYIYVTDNINGNYKISSITIDDTNNFAKELYSKTFDNASHIILIIVYNDNGFYISQFYKGEDAKKVVDPEFESIIFDYINYYQTKELSMDEVIGEAFRNSAIRAMKVTSDRYYSIVIISVIGGLLSTIAFGVRLHRKEVKSSLVD